MHLFFVLWMKACLFSAGFLFTPFLHSTEKGPFIHCPERKVNSGTSGRNNTISARYALINQGDEPLQIKEVRTNCSCSPAFWNQKNCAPGDTLWVELKFSPKGYPPGPFTQSASVISNARNSPYLLIMEGYLK